MQEILRINDINRLSKSTVEWMVHFEIVINDQSIESVASAILCLENVAIAQWCTSFSHPPA